MVRQKRGAEGDGGGASKSLFGSSDSGSVASLLSQGKKDPALESAFSKLFSAGGEGHPSAGSTARASAAAAPVAAKQQASQGAKASVDSAVAARRRANIGLAVDVAKELLHKGPKEKKKRKREAPLDAEAKGEAEPEPARQAKPVPVKRQLSEDEKKERETRTLFVGNVPLAWDKPRLRKALKDAVGDKYEGKFEPIWFRNEPLDEKFSGKMRKVGSILGIYAKNAADAKNAYVVLDDAAAVRTVSKLLHSKTADANHVLRADGVGASSTLTTFDRKRSVFLGNLPANASEADIRTAMKPAGEVDAVRVVRDKVMKTCKGFAFVRFKDRWSVKASLALWGTEVGGRPIRVDKVWREGDQDGEGDPKETDPDKMHPAALRMVQRGEKRARRRAIQALKKPDRGPGGGAKKKNLKRKSKPKGARIADKKNKAGPPVRKPRKM